MHSQTDDWGIDPAQKDRLASIMSQIEGIDFERYDPPADLWDKISASVAADTATMMPGSGSIVEYSINADDIVIGVDGDWAEFARDNDGPELAELEPKRTLWSYIDGDEVRDLWRLLVERVRASQTQASVPLRCDAPDMRRWVEMTITPTADGIVHFRSLLVFEQARDEASLFGPISESADDSSTTTVAVCSWCGRGLHNSRWLEIEDLLRALRLLESPSPSVTYGICTTCREVTSADLLVPVSPAEPSSSAAEP